MAWIKVKFDLLVGAALAVFSKHIENFLSKDMRYA